MLDLRRLRYFRAIAEYGSVSAAARALNVAQPALSYHISELESSLGAQLLERMPQGVRLTAIGQLLLEHARIIIESFERAESELREAAAPAAQSRVVSLAIIPTLTPLTPDLIGLMERDLPDTSLHLIEARTQQSHEMIENGIVDFAVNLVDLRTPTAEPVCWESLYFVSARSPDTKTQDQPIRFSDLAREPLIIPGANNPIRVLVEKIARDVGVQLNIKHEIDGLDPRKQAITAGLGGTLMSYMGIEREVETGVLALRQIIDPPVTRPMMLEHRPGLEDTLVEAMRYILKRIIEPALLIPNT